MITDLEVLRHGFASFGLLDCGTAYGSISKAARECGVTQQSASARLRGVERQLGLELFLRTPRGVVPTAEGETVASPAEGVLAGAERFRAGIETLRDERRREVTVAASQTAAAHMIPAWLVALREAGARWEESHRGASRDGRGDCGGVGARGRRGDARG